MTSSTGHSDIRRKIVGKQYEDALADLAGILQRDPDDLDALYMSAVCLRYLRRFDQALDCLASLKRLAPDHGRAWQEEGHVYRDAGRDEQALQAYSRATWFNPALVAGWREQERILAARGLDEQAGVAAAERERLENLPPPLVAVIDLVAQGRLLKAEDLVRAYLQKNPTNVEGMRLLADIGMRLGVLDDAEFLLEAAVRFEPDNIPARIDYIAALRKRQRFRVALEQATELLAREPGNPRFQSVYAVECMQNGQYERAIEVLNGILDKAPRDPVTLTTRGHALKTRGHYDEAVASYRRAIEAHPQYGEAWYSLANLKVYSFSGAELAAMRAREQNAGLSYMDRVYLSFALAKAYEDREEYAQAFAAYRSGNSLKKQHSRYDARAMTRDLDAQRQVCSAGFFDERAGFGHGAPDPIFIVGLPRAGSTLLEQILASHSAVDGTLELPNVLSLAQRLRRRSRSGKQHRYPEVLAELEPDELAGFGETYIRDTAVHRQGAPFFIDKMPNNFRHIGLIRLMLPNAKIVDARRHPMACCVSGYRQLFAEGQEFSYDLGDLGTYYRDYVRLMDHWDEVLPGFVHRVHYEDVIDSLESEVHRLLEFCGLPFEEQCLEYWKTARSVRTPSSEQVRQPIFRTGVDAWRNYEPWLDPLKVGLGEDVRARFGIE